jgi:hypothetical protein
MKHLDPKNANSADMLALLNERQDQFQTAFESGRLDAKDYFLCLITSTGFETMLVKDIESTRRMDNSPFGRIIASEPVKEPEHSV